MNRIKDFELFYQNEMEAKSIDVHIWMSNYLVDRLELNDDQILWFCFLTSITYHLPTAYMIINEYPDLELVDEDRLREWWLEVQKVCPFQKDKLKQRKFLPDTIISYQKMIGKQGQKAYFDELLVGTPEENFDVLYDTVYKDIAHFGRFSTWNWIQSLAQIFGYDLVPSILFLGESNAESITHGMCYVLGEDEWAHKERYVENGKRKKKVHKFLEPEKELLEDTAQSILSSLKSRNIEVDPFYLETVLCAFKKTLRTNDSRYIGYYNDRMAEDIKSIEFNGFTGVDWSILYDARNELLHLDYIHNSVQKHRFKWDYTAKINKPEDNEW